MFNNPNPNCERNDCRFTQGVSMTTDMYYPPIYDKNGVNTNPDGNLSNSSVQCSTCGKKWESYTRYNETTYKECND